MTGVFLSLKRPRRVRKRIAAALIGLAAIAVASGVSADPIQGAGSTFAAPIINQWSRDYEVVRADGGDFTSPDWRVDYEPVGSLAGVMRLSQPETDFAATDAPLPPDEIERRGWTQFPIVMGGIVVVANIDGIGSGEVRLTGPLLADIYLGKVRNWADPAIAAINPGVALPDAEIEVLHREDGSGSTLTFASFLAASSAEWKEKLGADTLIDWPVGRGERGTGGLAALAAGTQNSIAYLEYGQVVRAGLPFVSLQSASGAVVRPEPAAFQSGLGSMKWDAARGFYVDAGEGSAPEAWPMAVVTYAIVPKDRGPGRVNRVLDLFALAFGQGGDEASALGYIAVSPDLARDIEAYWAASLGRKVSPTTTN